MKIKPCKNRDTGQLNGNIFFIDVATHRQIELSTQTQWIKNQLVHKFNGDYENPTLATAVLILDGKDVGNEIDLDLTKAITINHFIIQDGYIRYLPDSTHQLKGRTVLLPDF